jgi:hypothetical protein
MSNKTSTVIFDSISDEIAISRTSYEIAAKRYKDIGEWLGRPDSQFAMNKPRVFSQGSFRLGTATKPIDSTDDYDLDLVINLEEGILKRTHSQKQLKTVVGRELEGYRQVRGIEKALEEKHRCWRLNYKDSIQFHMDILPSIPESSAGIEKMASLLMESGVEEDVSGQYAQSTLAITDDRSAEYQHISEKWDISNPEGYALWFKTQMRKARVLLEERAQLEKVASVEELPAYAWGSPLQQAIQIMKRHRDLMFKDKMDAKPISIIITTLAGHAYDGEQTVDTALASILQTMGTYVRDRAPRIPNPVDPREDFADRWSMDEGRALNLESNFWNWLTQVKSDLNILSGSADPKFIAEQAMLKYGANLKVEKLGELLPAAGAGISIKNTPKDHKIVDTAKPWGE